ncbi:MAG: T9SS type A sorting domain-containing protein [Bacteroidota bacterium]
MKSIYSLVKSIFLLSAFLLCLIYNSFAQTSGINYSYSLPGGALAYNSSTAGQVDLITAPNTDDQLVSFPASAVAGWGGFFYCGVWYPQATTTFWVSSNGWMAIQNTANPSDVAPPSSLPINDLAGNPYRIIAPLWDDLKLHPVSGGRVTYKNTGGGTTRILVIEWKGMYLDKTGTDSAISFQARICNSANVSSPNAIDFRYKRNGSVSYGLSVAPPPTASIGINGFCANDILAWTDNTGMVVGKTVPEYQVATKPPDIAFRFTPVVHPNDDCATAFPITFTPGTALISTFGTTLHATQSGAVPSCGGFTATSDVWYTFTKPANITNFEIFTDNLDCRGVNYKTGIEVYTSCAAPIACNYGSSGPTYMNNAGALIATNASSYLNLTNATNGVPCGVQQYWVRVSTDSTYRGYFRFNIRPSGRDCAYATNITPCTIPYTAPTGLSTCNFGNEYDSTISACHNSFNKGSDYVFSYTPPATICADFHLANTPANSFPAFFIYNGCPSTGNCLGSATGAGGPAAMNFNNVTLATGNTYYFVVEYDSTNITPCLSSFDFSITLNLTSPPIYDNCGNAPNVPVNNSASANCAGGITYYNSCATPSAAGTIPVPSCGNFTDGVTPDVWFRFTSSAIAQAHTINVNPMFAAGDAQDLCMQIYGSVCGTLDTVGLSNACDDNSSGFNFPALTFIPPATGTVYYIRIWSNDGTQPGNFNICAIVGCTPANDLPCNAINLTLGVAMNGDNACSSGAGEPGLLPSCWDVGTLNTVWYKFTPGFTGNVNIRTRLFSLFDSQIAVYTGVCGPGLVLIGGTNCNNDITEGCAGGLRTYRHSVINNMPVTSGTTYYVRVDGRGANTGTFEILVIDALQPLPPVPVQDCIVAQTVCSNSSFTVADPGYQGIGHYCDLATAPGCFVGERSSAWYVVSIQNPAPGGSFFQFSINPFAGTDYDFFVWRIDGVANYCSVLNNYVTAGFFPWYRGSWTDTYGPTGVSLSAGSGTTSLCISAVGPAFHPAYPVTGGETFLILVSNWWGNTSGFTMDWLGTPISGIPPVRIWQNSVDSVWTTTTNWSPVCGGVPTCVNQIAAVITNSGVAPYIAANTTVKDITINAGANLRLAAGITLSVCGDFTNNGTLTCGAGSTIQFTGAAALQQISGTYSFVPSNSFPNLWVNKSSGTVKLNSSIYISGNDSIINGIVDNNLKSTFLKGHFFNFNGATSFTNLGSGAGGSTLNFSGAGPQNYTNLVSNLTLNNVTAFQVPGSLITLGAGAFNNLILGTGGILTLTAGKIVTNALLVDVTNTAAGAVTPGNIFSFVQGNLRRSVPTGVGTYEYPVGEATKGYQRFSLAYTTAPTSAHTITSKFTQWSAMPPTGPAVIECVTANWACCAPYDNGYWTLDASLGSGLGTYTANAYPTNVTNDIGAAPNGYSIMKAVSNSGGGPWLMMGTCVTPGTGVTPVSRTGLNSFSDFGVVQFISPLPIELLSFDAEQAMDGTVLTKWATGSEINNDHFAIERSLNGSENFKSIGSVKGFGAGATSQNHYYSFRDPEQCSGINYYRLKQVDIDGRFTYSNVVAVRCADKDKIVSVYPNPSNTKINVSFFEVVEGKISLEILDMFGNILSTSSFAVTKDLNNIEVKIEQLANGFYYLRLKNSDEPGETSRQVKFLKY